ncbi:MAG: protoporphyrinogen oxidase [Magnetococcales bacterium]|nr:protoporphyrinogen oxidase [Magnetococcales bacterium]
MSQESTIVIGGGISGLATAWFLYQEGYPVQLLESRSQPGGTILTSDHQGYRIEHGPNSTLQRQGAPDDALGRLIEQLDLEKEVVSAPPAAQIRYVVQNGQPQPLPTSPLAFLTTRLFSLKAKLRLLAEPFIGRAKEEESIASFVRRRLGKEFLNYAIEPFISGVYAGNPERLSVQAAVPKIYALEKQYRSLIFGAIARGRVAKGAGQPVGRMISFKNGMGQLPETVINQLPKGTVHLGHKVVALEPQPDGSFTIHWEKGEETGTLNADRVVLALPAPAVAELLAPFAPEAGEILHTIPYAPIASIAFGFKRSQVKHSLDGFGFLTPRSEKLRILGALFMSTLFKHRAPKDHVLLNVFVGGMMDTEVEETDDETLVNQMLKELKQLLGLSGKPTFIFLTRHKRSIPQYTFGHLDRLKTFDQMMENYPGLHFRANWREGISVADCVKNAEILVDSFEDFH